MTNIIQNIAGMGNMTDQVIATDFLLGSKSAIKSYAAALAETATPQVRETLNRHLTIAIGAHEKITNYMMDNGYYHAYDPIEQFRLDLQAADKALEL